MIESLKHSGLAVLALAAVSHAVYAQQYVIDPAHTAITFQVAHAGISWTHGRFNAVQGAFSVNGANSQFATTIDAASIDTGNQQRDDHLRSPDFFNVKQFPTLAFQSTKVEPVQGGLSVSGELTLHGVKKPITFLLKGGKTAEFPPGVQRIGYSTSFRLKRSEFGMTNMLEAVGDDVYVNISFEGIEQ